MSIILQLVDSISWLRRVMFSDFVDLLSTVTNSTVMTFLEQRLCIFFNWGALYLASFRCKDCAADVSQLL